MRGPAYIGKNCILENATIQLFTSIGDDCEIKSSEIEHSFKIACRMRIIDSIIEKTA